MADQEWVYIKHPKVDAIGGPVHRSSFDALWKDKGWSITDDIDLTVDEEGREIAVARTAKTTAPKGA